MTHYKKILNSDFAGDGRMSHNVQFETGVRIGATSTAISTALALNLLIILREKTQNKNNNDDLYK